MAITRSKLGFFEATKGAATGFIGAGTYSVAARLMGWTQPAMLEAAGVIALGRFIYGLIASDDYGRDLIQRKLSISLGLSIAAQNAQSQNDIYSILSNPSQEGIDNLNDQLASNTNRAVDKIFTCRVIFSLVKNIASGLGGFGMLNYVLNAGTLTLPLKQIVLDASIGAVVSKTVPFLAAEATQRFRC